MLWKNITIQAHKPGEITCAKNWIMENVTLLVPSDDTIKLNQVENVELPVTYKIESFNPDPADPKDAGHVLGH